MTIRRVWLDWQAPCLPQVAAWLVDHANGRGADVCDLQETICVVPGQRAGRILLELMVEECEARGLHFVPPHILTPGALLGRMTADQPVATPIEITLAWMKALRECNHSEIHALLPQPPASDDVMAWHALATMLAKMHDDLAGGNVTFAQAAHKAESMEMNAEGERWRALARVFATYCRVLHDAGLIDRHNALQSAIEHSPLHLFTASSLQSLVLIAVPELNAMQRKVIHGFAGGSGGATALIHAPAEMSDRFDEFGCVPADGEGGWSDALIGLNDSQIDVVDRPDDQAQKVMRTISNFNGEYAPDQITIGLGDESQAAPMQRWAQWAGLRVHSPIGEPLAQTAPLRFLRATADWLAEPRFANFAALLRHPDVEAWINRAAGVEISDWLTLLDRYFADHLHERLSGQWLCEGDRREKLSAVYAAVQQLLAPLKGAQTAGRPLAEWGPSILQTLAALYEGDDNRHGNALAACCQLREALAELIAAPASLQPRTDAAGAIRWALLQTESAGEALIDPPQANEIEMLGWLELHLDPAPALIIAGFNEGFIPRSNPGDPFLPDSLRSVLGLSTRAQRYARDAYLIEAIRHSRTTLTIVLGRHTAEGDPLAPSRLLLSCDAEVLVRRITSMCSGRGGDRSHGSVFGPRSAQSQSEFRIPTLPNLPPRTSMRITEFRNYLACPYRYALGVVLRLESVCDAGGEMDAMAFGSLAHDVLCDFGTNEAVRHSADAGAIERYMLAALERHSRRKFGESLLPAVRVQLARLEQRLRSFASFQAKHRARGWQIKYCEQEFKQSIALEILGEESMPLSGKIDRIDFNERTGQYLIVDYKTGEAGESPCKIHHGYEKIPQPDLQWKDLQLPLYHYLATRSDLGIAPADKIQLGYICLPRQSDGVELLLAEWNAEHLDHALEAARNIVRKVRAGEFPMNPDFDGRFDDFARICQTTVYRGEGDDELDGEGGDE